MGDLSGLISQANMTVAPIEAQRCRLINSASGLVIVMHAADAGVVQLEWFVVATPPAATSPVSYLPPCLRGKPFPNGSLLELKHARVLFAFIFRSRFSGGVLTVLTGLVESNLSAHVLADDERLVIMLDPIRISNLSR